CLRLLCFLSYVYYGVLHSFPTRRSSDLGYSTVKGEINYQAQNLFHMKAFPRFPIVDLVSGINRVKNGFYLKDASAVAQLNKNTRDRKSTRLNSSHVSISYAVFCLKKKTR